MTRCRKCEQQQIKKQICTFIVFGLIGFAIESNTDALGEPNNGHSCITGIGNRVAG